MLKRFLVKIVVGVPVAFRSLAGTGAVQHRLGNGYAIAAFVNAQAYGIEVSAGVILNCDLFLYIGSGELGQKCQAVGNGGGSTIAYIGIAYIVEFC